MKHYLIIFLCAVMFSAPVFAADEPPQPIEAPVELGETSKERLQQLQDKADQLNKDVADLMAGLDEEQMRHFSTVYSNHNVLGSVQHARNNVKIGVESCVENNPGEAAFHTEIEARFAAWDDRIASVVKDAEEQLTLMIAEQNYTKPSEIRSIFKQSEALRDATGEEFEQMPISDLRACRNLLETMDHTEERLYNLIGTTLVTVPAALEEAE